MTEKLDFHFMPHDDILEARLPDGFLHISELNQVFHLYGYHNKECLELGMHPTLYEALDAANEWYYGKEYSDE